LTPSNSSNSSKIFENLPKFQKKMGECISWGLLVVFLVVILLIYNHTMLREYFEPTVAPPKSKVRQYDGVGRPADAGGRPVQVIQTQSGGIAGVNIVTTLDIDGNWTQTGADGYTNTRKLDPVLARNIIAGAENASPARDQGCMDCFNYSVTLVYPSTQRVRKGVGKSVFPDSMF
jgi:hypothetical protein